MAGKYRDKMQYFEQALAKFSSEVHPLEGVKVPANRRVLAEQIVSSLRRIEYARQLTTKTLSPRRADPNDNMFDPLMAACILSRAGEIDEAWWLVFLATHFGKHHLDGWRLARDFYGAFGTRPPWHWHVVCANPEELFAWLGTKWVDLLKDGIHRRFSNHRKYESKSPSNISAVIRSYVDLINKYGGHRNLIVETHRMVGQNPYDTFDKLYQVMGAVNRFGRLGTFDFLTMLGKLEIAPIEPKYAYLASATGPLSGAKLLVGGNVNARISADELESILEAIDQKINVGKQVLEDSLCNWQKSPSKFVPFSG